MTKLELNRDIKRLAKNIAKNEEKNSAELPLFLKAEYMRLYYADTSLMSYTQKSVLIMLRLNVRYRFVPLHIFGLAIDLNKL